ncbi:MAG: MFS transporter [Euryarchaeota archaeon]|nr:MFS transporter [Euryarchaeota archaeon]
MAPAGIRRGWTYGLTRNIVLLGVASLLTDVSSEIIVPLLPLFLLGVLGTSYLALGLIESVAESTVSLLKVLSGHISDRFGKRKRLVALGYGFSALMKTGLPFATVWPHVLAVRVGDRVGKGVRDPPRDALIAESTRPDTIGKAFGFHRTMDTTGAILGPLLVLVLLPSLTVVRGTDQAFRDMFLLAVIPAALAFFVILAVREVAVRPKVTLRLRVSLRALPIRLRLFVIVAALYSLANFTLLIPIAFVSDLGEVAAGLTREAAQTLAVLYYLLFNVVYAILAVHAGSWSDRIGRKPVILIGYSAFVAGSLGFALVGNPFLLLPFFLLYGISYAFVEGTHRALVADLAPAGLKATSLGTYHAAVGVGKLPASILAGALATFVSPGSAFLAAAAIAIVAGTFFVGTFAETRPVTRASGPLR